MQTISKLIFISIAALSFICCISLDSVAQKADFSGSWAINKEKSNLGGVPPERAAAESIKITQKADVITMERLFTNLPLNIETFPFDGKPVQTVINENTSVTRNLIWSENGQILTIASKYTVKDSPVGFSRTETYILGDAGKSLIVQRETVAPNGTEKVKALYDKK